MNTKQLREMAEIMKENGLSMIEITEGETHIQMIREKEIIGVSAPHPVQQAVATAEPNLTQDVDFNDLAEITSPLVGVFYAAPSPDSKPFVKIGSQVKKGDVLCIVEAMKLMNEIVAEESGEIVDICAENGDVVEYGQVLFKLH